MHRYKSQIMVILGLFLAILIAVIAFLGGVKVEVMITVNPPGAGQIEGEGRYSSGKEVTINAQPNEGYVFYEWIKKGERFAVSPNYSFKIWEKKDLEARFLTVDEVREKIIRVSVTPEAAGTVETEPYDAHASKIVLNAVPENSFEFRGWIIDGELIETKMVYVADIHKEKEIIARFEEIEE